MTADIASCLPVVDFIVGHSPYSSRGNSLDPKKQKTTSSAYFAGKCRFRRVRGFIAEVQQQRQVVRCEYFSLCRGSMSRRSSARRTHDLDAWPHRSKKEPAFVDTVDKGELRPASAGINRTR